MATIVVRYEQLLQKLYRCFGQSLMPNFMNLVIVDISSNKNNLQGLGFDREVRIAALFYSGPISAISTKEQLLGEKIMRYISKTAGLVRICKDEQTGIDSVRHADHLYARVPYMVSDLPIQGIKSTQYFWYR